MYIAWGLAVSGLLLIFLEFFLPGAVMAIGGGMLLLASLFFFHMSEPSFISLLVYLAALAVAVLLVVKIALWKVSKKGIISEGSQEGFQASLYVKELVGKTGFAATDLKPSGHIAIDEGTYEALSQSGYIDKGTPIQVLSGQGSHLIVKKKET